MATKNIASWGQRHASGALLNVTEANRWTPLVKTRKGVSRDQLKELGTWGRREGLMVRREFPGNLNSIDTGGAGCDWKKAGWQRVYRREFRYLAS